LYDLAWHSLEDEKSRRFFDEIVKEVKAKQRKRLEVDEKTLAEKMKAIVTTNVEG
jgi:polyhydroxyalkanoate synthesis regulator phasin